MRATTKFVCQQCSYQSPSFLGRCPNCGAWNSLVETIEESEARSEKSARGKSRTGAKPQRITEIKTNQVARVATGMGELDRVLGGGLLPGAVMLLSGDPGIGKSTLLLHVALHLAKEKKTILYVSGEESIEQIKLRVDRLVKLDKQKVLSNFYLLAETSIDTIVHSIEKLSPDLLIVDSIQTMETSALSSMAGSVGQIRESTNELLKVAKGKHIPLFLVGHVTKEGTNAGPQELTHMVDSVLFLEGERFQSLRLLRSLKNRFGPLDEVGVFEMTGIGFKEVTDPNEVFTSSGQKLPGKAIVLTLEGTRPLLCEIQALVVPTKLSFPKRVVSGLDGRRVEIMVAVLQKILRLPLERFDIFVSTTAGLKIFEPGLDLGICLAIISSFKNKAMINGVVAVSEVSLLGELRNPTQMEGRLKEAKRLGFKKILSAEAFPTLLDVTRKAFI